MCLVQQRQHAIRHLWRANNMVRPNAAPYLRNRRLARTGAQNTVTPVTSTRTAFACAMSWEPRVTLSWVVLATSPAPPVYASPAEAAERMPLAMLELPLTTSMPPRLNGRPSAADDLDRGCVWWALNLCSACAGVS